MRYRRELVSLVDQAREILESELRSGVLNSLTEAADVVNPANVRRDTIADDIAALMARLRERLGRIFSADTLRSITEFVSRETSRFNLREINAQLRSLFGGGLTSEPYLPDELAEFVRENVSLIRDLETRLLRDVEGIISRGVLGNASVDAMAEDIIARTGVTRRRAETIARDQVGTLTAQLTRKRHQAAGITEFIWITQLDERVRPSHAERQGRRFSYANPPDGELPGSPINCRCTATPVPPEF